MFTNKNPKLRSVRVEYVKGKYSYKQRMNILSDQTDKFQVELSGTIKAFQSDPDSILTLYDVERRKGRLDKESRDILKGLQMNLSSPSSIISKGVTHILVYECLSK